MIELNNIWDELICEGGASGHMQHIFEDPDLTFKELKDIFTKLFTGKIGIEEKTDGQNLAITYKDGQFGAARNKATLKEPMSIEDVEKMFEGRGEVKDAFVKSMTDLVKGLKKLSQKELNSIFANGKNFMAFEIIYPPTKNVIDYGNRCLIQLHGINVYDDKYNKVSEDKEAAAKLYKFLKKHNALKQDTFEITGHTKLQLKNSKTGQESLDIVLKKLAELIKDLGWSATVNDYAKERFKKYIINRAIEADFPLSRNSEFVNELADRLSNISKRRPNKNDLAAFAKREGIDTKSEEYKNFVNELDASLDEANSVIIKPLEDLVIGAGLLLMRNLVGYISTDPQKTSKKLAAELNAAIEELSSKETSLDTSKLKRFKKNLAKLDAYQREVMPAEGIVFMYKGKVYKMTSTFGAANQIMGILKY